MSDDIVRVPVPETTPDDAAARDTSWMSNAAKVLRYAANSAGEKKLIQIASSLTFTTILAIVPLLAVVLALFTAFPLFADFQMALERFLSANLMPPAVSENIMGYLNEFAAQASRLTAIGGAFLIVTSIMLLMTIDEAFNSIWHVERQRPLRQRILVYWAIISLGPVLAGASLWATSFLMRESLGRVAELSGSLSFALSLIPILFTGLGFSALFMGVPNRQVYWKDALAGGFGTAIVLEIMKAGFTFYLARFPSYTVIYGAFATLPVFLLWIYLSWLAILFGATVAATLPSLRLRRWAENRQPGAMFVDAIRVIRLLHEARESLPPGRSLRFLCEQLRVHQDELLTVLETLKRLGYVVRTQVRNSDQWVLACDLRRAKLGPIIDSLLIDRFQRGFLDDPLIAEAVAASLAQPDAVTLETLLENGDTLPDGAGLVQNAGMVPHEYTEENHNAESQ